MAGAPSDAEVVTSVTSDAARHLPTDVQSELPNPPTADKSRDDRCVGVAVTTRDPRFSTNIRIIPMHDFLSQAQETFGC